MDPIDMRDCARILHDVRALRPARNNGGRSSFPVVTFDDPVHDADKLSSLTIRLLQDIMLKAGLQSIRVTSTVRDEDEQAAAMYGNLKAGKKVNYAAAGTKVQDVGRAGIKAGETSAVTRSKMAAEIRRVGPERVSRHAARSALETFDLSYKSMEPRQRSAFVAEVRQIMARGGPIVRFGHPGGRGKRNEFYEEPAFHLEVEWRLGDFPMPSASSAFA